MLKAMVLGAHVISIVIPNYNGEDLLRRHLPGVIEAARRENSAEVIVVDDASTDGSLGLLQRGFPSVRIVSLQQNVGFGRAVAEGAAEAEGDILVLLNTDVGVDPGFLAPLREGLEDETVFAVSCIDVLSGTPDAPIEVRHPFFRKGRVCISSHGPRGGPPFDTLFAPGGYAAYRRDLFVALGGLDPLYEPFYWEDADICYRAWKRGWRSVVEPRSRVRHEHSQGAILSTHGVASAKAMQARNSYLFLWKNITSRRMLLMKHILPTVRRAATDWAVLDGRFYLTVGRALGKSGAALERRRTERRLQRHTDEEVFERLDPGLSS
ncbi:MAG: glycosyltransferase [Planctomycetota bacterium]